MGEKPTGTGEDVDETDAAAAQKEQGPTKDAGRGATGINTTRSNIKHAGG